ncbi:MAG TPA: TetR/AcrR family transcriptional regulator C-terminal domain-containing protein, partial [Mycobacterium sp.]|nr:TetR/AcrR family transcriptional regulator C-terminal domain-containing protein [Mycobacterium sp.]
GKAALLDAISEYVLVEAVLKIDGVSDTWEEIARRTAHAYRAAAYRHPHVMPLLATRPQISAPALTSLERLVAAMRAAGLPDQVASDAPMMLFSFLNGYLLAVLGGGADGGPSVPPIDPGQYPALAQSIPAMADFGTDSEFDRMLDAVLSGIRAQAARYRTPRRQR